MLHAVLAVHQFLCFRNKDTVSLVAYNLRMIPEIPANVGSALYCKKLQAEQVRKLFRTTQHMHTAPGPAAATCTVCFAQQAAPSSSTKLFCIGFGTLREALIANFTCKVHNRIRIAGTS
ncbi:hypothetical protein ABBQ38_009856 [Trebouxia sp. C0009 RCD-2024]